ncbi:hypothetical protein [Chryseobacterium sp. 18068]|uniref:hypothetical protein n=1 Tax=Chryseobacterium sp. 18068 TaxID=2681414 RepID=UPI001357672C|nr:hypothetical protein [Chryseobacterium sp. 18068]
MNISLYDFKNLPVQYQSEIVLSEGRLMNEHIMNSFRYALYEISSFSVELIYHTANNKVAGLNIYQNRAAYSS